MMVAGELARLAGAYEEDVWFSWFVELENRVGGRHAKAYCDLRQQVVGRHATSDQSGRYVGLSGADSDTALREAQLLELVEHDSDVADGQERHHLRTLATPTWGPVRPEPNREAV